VTDTQHLDTAILTYVITRTTLALLSKAKTTQIKWQKQC